MEHKKYYVFMGYKKIGGEKMNPRIGRPKSDNPKTNPIHVRLDKETKEILETYCEQENVAKTEGIRRGIHRLKSEIKK